MASLLPYRFKAGGNGSNMAPNDQHHHRSTTKASHKPFKSKHLTKGAIKERNKGENAEISHAVILVG